MGKTGGGVEQYLDNLNRALIERFAMTIIQVYSAKENDPSTIEVERLGKGSLVWVPLVSKKSRTPRCVSHKMILKRATGAMLNAVSLRSAALSFRLRNHRYMHNPDVYYYEVVNRYISEIIDTCKIDLAAFHWVDERSESIMAQVRLKMIPFIIINHFDNTRYELPAMKKWARHARGCAGVSSMNVPGYLRSQFINLADGIDIDFFSPDRCCPPKVDDLRPIVFLPSRITPSKGHMDLIRALSFSGFPGVRPLLVLAGREDSTSFSRLLKSYIRKSGMENDVIFQGELDLKGLRDWYGACNVVVLPSYSEGLSRVVLEAQAMTKPVVAYDIAGISEAMKDGQTGYTAPVGDWRALWLKIDAILTDPARAKEMGVRGRELVETTFSFESLVQRHERFYSQSLSDA